MLHRMVSLVAGLLFGLGMMISGMVDPQNVIAFLDITGQWDPSLAFVMGGALMVFMPVYFLIIRRQAAPICGSRFAMSNNTVIDRRLLLGAALFGIGWGIAGICPGPAVTALGSVDVGIAMFIASMLLGQRIANRIPPLQRDVMKPAKGSD
ncbi:YeeE/YedE family protein [Thaumasiovibrio subtropicus]|uniref:YeeE/YedE family protein n=1 Tax=Thaumasiovibrio subtropicus TaxID=1891207 RepID=UPI001FEB63A6|nr:YeeE/YedE family protein [Thaumasiovibrio subtropicus]